MTFIPYGRQWIDDEDHAAVAQALDDPMLTQGETIDQFEAAIAEKVGARHCVAVSSATAALHIAVQALRSPDDGTDGVGLTTPNSFVATSNALLYSGMVPRFADIDRATGNLDLDRLTDADLEDISLFMPVHFAGLPVEVSGVAGRLPGHARIIEDASHAIGSHYADGSPVGSCRHSAATVFSFHPVKTMTTGEGGAITTNDRDVYDALIRLRSHGIERHSERMRHDHEGPWYYEMQDLGFNYRLTGLQAALGLSQLAKLDRFRARRSEIVRVYNGAFAGIDWLDTPGASFRDDVCYHLHVLQIDFAAIGMSRAEVMARLKDKGVGTQVHYIPIYRQPYYRETLPVDFAQFPAMERFYERCLSIPLYPAMTDGDVERVIDTVKALA
jgi:UDP-4-amino-4,6-dideoxy-N-acetyl-beta-L-altrosamine transaminase